LLIYLLDPLDSTTAEHGLESNINVAYSAISDNITQKQKCDVVGAQPRKRH